jgi:hypothetical protein
MLHSPMLYLLTFIYVLHILIGENLNNLIMWHYIAIIFSNFPPFMSFDQVITI